MHPPLVLMLRSLWSLGIRRNVIFYTAWRRKYYQLQGIVTVLFKHMFRVSRDCSTKHMRVNVRYIDHGIVADIQGIVPSYSISIIRFIVFMK